MRSLHNTAPRGRSAKRCCSLCCERPPKPPLAAEPSPQAQGRHKRTGPFAGPTARGQGIASKKCARRSDFQVACFPRDRIWPSRGVLQALALPRLRLSAVLAPGGSW